MTRPRSAERTEFLSDVLSTALEGGVNYWSSAFDIWRIGDYPKGEWYYDAVTLYEDADGDKHCSQNDEECRGHRVDLHGIARGINALVKRRDPGYRHRELLVQANRENYAGEIDSDIADDVAQMAALGALVYG